MESAILLWCLTVRVIQVLILQTYFNPDEYWQCLEVAHHLAFGYVTYTGPCRQAARKLILTPIVSLAVFRTYAGIA